MSVESPTPVIGYGEKRSSSTSRRQRLPKIEHPLKRRNSNEKYSLDVRGQSRNGQGNGKLIRNESSMEEQSARARRRSSSLRYHSFSDDQRQQDQVRLPIFGYRPDSIASSYRDDKDRERERERETPRTCRIIIDELETTLREKVRSDYHDVRTKFRHASHSNDLNARISRPALQHLIASIFGTQRQISPNHLDKLIERLDLKHLNQISFDEFLRSLFNDDEDRPQWLNRQISPRREESTSKRTSTQMFLILKEKVRTKNEDLLKLCPSISGGPPSRIFKAQLFNALIEMGYRMKDVEFDKLWEKFDTDGFKAIPSEKFLKRLRNESIDDEHQHQQSIQSNEKDSEKDSLDEQIPFDQSNSIDLEDEKTSHQSPRLTTSRGTQLDENQIQKWLNHKFPHGFANLEKALERLDTKQMGTLPRDRFLSELKRFGLKLEPNLFEFFLKRLNVDLSLTNGSVPYGDVINAFKERSDPTRKRINADNQISSNETRQSSLEKQIDFAISVNYDRVKKLIQRYDQSSSGTITTNELRAIIEDLLEYTLKADEYYQLLKQIPLDQHGKVIYQDYLKQVLDRSLALQEEQQDKFSKNSRWDLIKGPNPRSKLDRDELRRQRDSHLNDSNHFNDNREENEQQRKEEKIRSIDELRQMLKILIRNRYKDIEDQFKKLDRSSYGELNPDLLFDLFKRLSLDPNVSHAEVDLIWSRCHLKENGNLDFYQFLREFGYSKRSAHYPNAKHNPPKRGDADFLLTSRKLYGDSVLVHGTALNAIRSNWNELRREFAELDPYRTGFIQSDEFDEILTELCPSVNHEDLQNFREKFQTKHDSRMNYVHFLKRHVPVPEYLSLIDEPNRLTLPAIQEHSPRLQSRQSILSQVNNKLRRKLSDSYKDLRRAFKQIDSNNSGTVPVKQFKEILQRFKCSLNDEEFYSLISQIDTKMDGTINYNYFLQQYVKNN